MAKSGRLVRVGVSEGGGGKSRTALVAAGDVEEWRWVDEQVDWAAGLAGI